MKGKSRGKIPRNPMALPLAISAFVTLALAGLAALIGFDRLGGLFLVLILVCMLLLWAYTLVSIRIGWIATVGHLGQVHHFQRQKEPVMYWLLVVFYLVGSAPAILYLLQRFWSGLVA